MSAWHVAPGHYPGFLDIIGPSFAISVFTAPHNLTPEQSAQRVADAYILAAAQDMLSALQRLVRQHGDDGVVYTGDHPIAVARAAIAKAVP